MNLLKNCLILFSSFLVSVSFAQHNCEPDYEHHEEVDYLQLHEFAKNRQARPANAIDEVSVRVHVLRSNGQMADTALIRSNLELANEDFAAIQIEFAMCGDFNIIDNDELYILNSYAEQSELVWNNNDPNTVDIFYIGGETYRGYCGLATVGWNTDGYIVMVCNNAETLIHELGHYFNLSHTHSTLYGVELADGSNCSTAGDRLCDTPADPNLSGSVTTNCTYIGSSTDPNGDTYAPLTDNHMSYAYRPCRSSFTTDQLNRMRFYFEMHQNDMFTCSNLVDLSITSLDNSVQLSSDNSNTIKYVIKNHSFNTYTGSLDIKVSLKPVTGTEVVVYTEYLPSRDYGFNQSDTIEIVFDLPNNLEDGFYTLKTAIDNNDIIEEYNEENNKISNPAFLNTSEVLLPDLVAHIDADDEHESGSMYPVYFNITNNGNTTSEATGYIYIVSKDSILDIHDLKSGGIVLPSLGPKATYTGFSYLSVPKDLDSPFYVMMIADYSSEIEESNERNNFFIKEVKNIDPVSSTNKPDLIISAHNWPYGDVTEVVSLQRPYLKFTVENLGVKTYAKISTGVYFSQDQVLSDDDIFVMETINSYSQFRTPLYLPFSSGYIILKVDNNDYIYETDETNNTYVIPMNFTQESQADIGMKDIHIESDVWLMSEDNQIGIEVYNFGNATAASSYYNVFIEKEYYLYQHFNFNYAVDDIYNSAYRGPAIDPGSTHTYYYNVNLDSAEYDEDEYYLAVCAAGGAAFKDWEENGCMYLETPIKLVKELIATDVEDVLTEFTEPYVYPNPSTDQIMLVLPQEQSLDSWVIYDMSGQALKSGSSFNIDISDLASGFHFIKVNDAFVKFVKE